MSRVDDIRKRLDAFGIVAIDKDIDERFRKLCADNYCPSAARHYAYAESDIEYLLTENARLIAERDKAVEDAKFWEHQCELRRGVME